MIDLVVLALVVVAVLLLAICLKQWRELNERAGYIERLQTAYLAATHKLRRMREVMDSVR